MSCLRPVLRRAFGQGRDGGKASQDDCRDDPGNDRMSPRSRGHSAVHHPPAMYDNQDKDRWGVYSRPGRASALT
jgi:hypothetical protein